MLKREEYDEIINRIRTAVGEETAALISEDIALLVSDYTGVIESVAETTAQIEKLIKEKEDLIAVNGKLFLKVGSPATETEEPTQDETKENEEITDDQIINEKGEFING